MNARKIFCASVLVTLAWTAMPETSQAQIFRGRGGRYGGGYYGNGYYGNGYYRGGYGSGWSYGTTGYGVSSGNGYYSPNGYSTNNVATSPGVVNNGTPANATTSGYTAFYPSGTAMTSDCCCQSGSVPQLMSNGTTAAVGGGTVVVNLPANAELTWNGTRHSTSGAVRRIFTPPLNDSTGMQTFEARWQDSTGKTMTQRREIRAKANETVVVDFNRAQDGSEEATVPDVNRTNPSPNNGVVNPTIPNRPKD
jgi:uncharacterized protein (TIGR03000 family)